MNKKRCEAGCTYSRSMDQPYPRDCLSCGHNESTDPHILAMRWDALLMDLENSLASDDDLRKFALFKTFMPFKHNDLMMLVADSVLTRTKQLVLNEQGPSRRQLADAIKEVRLLFKHGTNEEQLMSWLDNLSMAALKSINKSRDKR